MYIALTDRTERAKYTRAHANATGYVETREQNDDTVAYQYQKNASIRYVYYTAQHGTHFTKKIYNTRRRETMKLHARELQASCKTDRSTDDKNYRKIHGLNCNKDGNEPLEQRGAVRCPRRGQTGCE